MGFGAFYHAKIVYRFFIVDTHPDRCDTARMKLTKNLITREEAIALCPEYVAWVENMEDPTPLGLALDGTNARWDIFEKITARMDKARKGDQGITYYDGQYVRVTVSSVKRDCIQAVDGPVVRVGNGEATWRCDGDKYVWLEPAGTAACCRAVDAVLANS